MVALVGKYRVKKILKKTSATFFKELKVGDVFSLEYTLNGSYAKQAPFITIYIDDKPVGSNNALQLQKNLSNFDLEDLIYLQLESGEEVANSSMINHLLGLTVKEIAVINEKMIDESVKGIWRADHRYGSET